MHMQPDAHSDNITTQFTALCDFSTKIMLKGIDNVMSSMA